MKTTTSAAQSLTVEGDLTIYRASAQKRELLAALVANERLDLDLSQVGAIDSAGFQLLVLAKRESMRLGHRLRIVGHSPAVREVIEFLNMVAYFGDPLVIPANERT